MTFDDVFYLYRLTRVHERLKNLTPFTVARACPVRCSFSQFCHLQRYRFSCELLKQHRNVAWTGIGQDMISSAISQRRVLLEAAATCHVSVVSIKPEVRRLSEASGAPKSNVIHDLYTPRCFAALSFASAYVQVNGRNS